MKLAELRKSGHTPSLVASFLYFDVSFMIWVILGALGVFITKDFGLSPAQKGFIVGVPILSGSFFRLILGLLTDRIGPKKTAIIGMLVTMVPLVWAWLFGKTLTELYLIGILLGVAGASFAAAIPMASRWYPPHLQGLAMGIAEKIGWHNVIGLAIIPLSIVFILYIVMAKDAPLKPSAKKPAGYFTVFKQKDTLYFCLLYSVTFGGFVGLSSFLSIFFVDQYQLSKVSAGDFVTLCVAAGSFFRPVGGSIADRIGGIRLLTFLFIAVALCMFGVSQLPSLPLVTTLLFFGMLFLGMGNGAVFQLIPQRFQAEIGTITGIVGAAGGIGGFFVPNILGTLKQITGTYTPGFMVYAGIGLAGLVIILLAKQSWQKAWTSKEVSRQL
jgi:NNP family nitrate/nitrite transporter-like MFS transporter